MNNEEPRKTTKPSAVKYLADAILSQRYNKDIFDLHDAIHRAYLIEKELLEEIPNEEIEREARKMNGVSSIAFEEGAKWYKEQLKKA